jgi:hypothetical protein
MIFSHDSLVANEQRDEKIRKIKSAKAVIGATAIGIPFGTPYLQGVPVIPDSPEQKHRQPAIKLKSKPTYIYSIN